MGSVPNQYDNITNQVLAFADLLETIAAGIRQVTAKANSNGSPVPVTPLRPMPHIYGRLLPNGDSAGWEYQLRWVKPGDTRYSNRQYQTLDGAVEAVGRLKAKAPTAVHTITRRRVGEWREYSGEVVEGREYRVALTRADWTSWRTFYRGAAGTRSLIVRNSDAAATLRVAERDVLGGWEPLGADLEAVA